MKKFISMNSPFLCTLYAWLTRIVVSAHDSAGPGQRHTRLVISVGPRGMTHKTVSVVCRRRGGRGASGGHMGIAGGPDSAGSRYRTVVRRQGSTPNFPSPANSRLRPWVPAPPRSLPFVKDEFPSASALTAPAHSSPWTSQGPVPSSPRPGGGQLGAPVSRPGEGPSL